MSVRPSIWSRRRWAAVLVVVGAFLLSTGATMTAASASPQAKVYVCHATDSDSHPYNWLHVNGNSADDFGGHGNHRSSPNKEWKSAGTWNGIHHAAGDKKRDYIQAPGLDPDVTEAFCTAPVTDDAPAPTVVDGALTITEQPTCSNNGLGSWTTSGAHISFSPASGTGASGQTVSSTGTAASGYAFAGGSTKQFSTTFDTFDPASCLPGAPVVQTVTADVNVTQPSCANSGVGSWSVSGDHLTFAPVSSGTGGPGATYSTVATAASGYAFSGGSTTKTFSGTFAGYSAPAGQHIDSSGACVPDVVVNPPVDHKVAICHATRSDTNPYVYIVVDKNSTKYKGHLMHRDSPNKTWKHAGFFNGVFHLAGAPKPDLIDGLDGTITKAICDLDVTVGTATATLTITQPSCATSGVGTLGATGTNVTFAPSSSVTGTTGQTKTITATAAAGYEFADHSTSKVLSATFLAYSAPAGSEIQPDGSCVVVLPPLVLVATPVAPTFTDPTCTVPGIVALPTAVKGITYTTTGSFEGGGTAVVTGVLSPGYSLDPAWLNNPAWDGSKLTFSHTFPVPSGCVRVDPPVVDPPVTTTPVVIVKDPATTTVVTPTTVHAGLAGTPVMTPAGNGFLTQLGMAATVLGGLLLGMGCCLALGRQRRALG